jgi:phosphoribosyl 1,2-cyclic phosphodiesterase
MRVKFWGTRGSVPTPGRATEKYGGNTACVEISQDGDRLILDAGTGIRELGLQMLEQEPRPTSMLFSHVHWDHIQGLPFFTPLFSPAHHFFIFAPSKFKGSLRKVLYKQMAPDVFPVDFGNLAARIEFETLASRGTPAGPFTIDAFPLTHPGGSWGYRVRGASQQVIYATDNEFDPEADPQAYAELVDQVRGADLLIADGQYTLAEYPGKRGWGHGVLEYVTRLAEDANIQRLAITHHDPMRDDNALTALERQTRKALPDRQVFFARDGLAVEV